MLVSGTAPGTAEVWDACTGTLKHTVRGERITVRAVAWSPNGHFLAIATGEGTVRLWAVATGETTRILPVARETFALSCVGPMR